MMRGRSEAMMIEVLVLLQTKLDAAQRVREQFEVAAALPPRLLIVRIVPTRLAELRANESVLAVAEDSLGLANVSLQSEEGMQPRVSQRSPSRGRLALASR